MFLLSKLIDIFFEIALKVRWFRMNLYKNAINHQLRSSGYGKLALSRLNRFMSQHPYTHQEFLLAAGSTNYQQSFWQSDLGFVWFNNSIHNENQYFNYGLEQMALANMCSVIDIGCGWGAFCASAVTLPGVDKVLGIDISEKIINEAKSRHSHKNLTYSVSEIFNINQQFDFVTVFGAIDYINPDKIIEFLEQVLTLSKKQIFIVNSLRGIPIGEAKKLRNSIEIKRYDIGYVQPLYHFFSDKKFQFFKFEKMGHDSQVIHIIQ